MEIKIKLTNTEDKDEINIVSDEQSAKFFFFSLSQLIKNIMKNVNNPIISKISPFFIDSQLKKFYYQLKAEKELRYPFNFRGKSGTIVLMLKDNIEMEIDAYEVKEVKSKKNKEEGR